MTVRIGDIDVNFRESGTGIPTVFIHGLGEDHRSWGKVQDALTDFHTFAYDLRGHGKTSLGDAEGTLAQLGGDLIAFLEAQTGPANCAGFSLGGTVVMWTAIHRPDLVRRAVIVGSSSVVGGAAEAFYHDRIAKVQSDLPGFLDGLSEETGKQLAGDNADLETVAAWRREAVGDGRGYMNAARAMAGIRQQPLTPQLAQISCPVDVIGADKDVFCPKKAADIICGGIPGAAYSEIAGAGHLMSIDQPEIYADTLRAALNRAA